MTGKKDKVKLLADLLWRASNFEDKNKIAEAIKLYKIGASLGDPIAQSNLGNLLDDKIKPPRHQEAVYWYKRAVKSGSYVGAWNLAMHYRNRGKQRWQLHWLRVAAAMGDPDAPAAIRKLKGKLKKA